MSSCNSHTFVHFFKIFTCFACLTAPSNSSSSTTSTTLAFSNVSISPSHSQSPSPRSTQTTDDANVRFFFDAVDSANVTRVRELITEYGVKTLFSTNSKGETPIQAAFSSRNSFECGNAMLDAIKAKLN